jgi:hypothetical protein
MRARSDMTFMRNKVSVYSSANAIEICHIDRKFPTPMNTNAGESKIDLGPKAGFRCIHAGTILIARRSHNKKGQKHRAHMHVLPPPTTVQTPKITDRQALTIFTAKFCTASKGEPLNRVTARSLDDHRL